MHILVVMEHDTTGVRTASLHAIEFARKLQQHTGASITALVLGSGVDAIASDVARYAPVLLADDEALRHPVADRFAQVIATASAHVDADFVVAASTSWSKDIVGRVAGLLGGAMASDVVSHEFVEDELHLRRPMFAGAVDATVVLNGSPRIVTVRPSSYEMPPEAESKHTVETIAVDANALPDGIQFERLEAKKSDRPDVTEANIVVSGGRAFKDSEDFERLVGGLADCLNAAVGSSRALVDAGITPNSLQVGQTGKIVAPTLYIALGISGAVQHLAGMKNSKLVVAINRDPEAPIFEVADYGLVGDVYEVIPQLIAELSGV